MNRRLLVIGCLLAGSASAGVRIETITRQIGATQQQGLTQVVEVQNGAVRAGTEQGTVLIKNGTMYILDDRRKTYSVMDAATMQAYASQASAAMARMQAQMQSMTPEQRKQMEAMMGGMKMPGAPGSVPVYEAKDTGKSDTVEGRKCRLWNLLQDGSVVEEMCVVPYSSLPGKEDMQKSMKQLAEAFAGVAKGIPGAAEQAKARSNVDGYPVRTRVWLNGKAQGSENVLKSWTEAVIPAATFEIPAGYQKKDLPTMGPGQ